MHCNANFTFIGLKSHKSRGTTTITYPTPLSTCAYLVDSCKAIGIDRHECNVSAYLKELLNAVDVVCIIEVIDIPCDQEGQEYGRLDWSHKAIEVIFVDMMF